MGTSSFVNLKLAVLRILLVSNGFDNRVFCHKSNLKVVFNIDETIVHARKSININIKSNHNF